MEPQLLLEPEQLPQGMAPQQQVVFYFAFGKNITFYSLLLIFKDPAQPQPQQPHQLQRLRSQPQPQWLWRRPRRLALVPLPQVNTK